MKYKIKMIMEGKFPGAGRDAIEYELPEETFDKILDLIKWRTAACYQCKHFDPLMPYCPNNTFSRDLPDWSGDHSACVAFEEAKDYRL